MPEQSGKHMKTFHLDGLLQEANAAFFTPRSMSLTTLKKCSSVIPQLAQWVYDEWKSYDRTLAKEKLIQSFQERTNEDHLPITFVVIKDGAPIATVSVKSRPSEDFADFPEHSLWLGSLQVLPGQRKQGVGSKLLKFAAQLVTHLEYKELYFYTSKPDFSWYTKQGAKVLQSRPFRNHTITILSLS